MRKIYTIKGVRRLLPQSRCHLLAAVGGLLGLCLILAQPAVGQAHQVQGSVTDRTTGEPLAGATVVVKGTSVGTATGIDGTYSLSVPSSQDTLVFSFVGFISQEIAINGRSQIDVGLEVLLLETEEVVVVGYGAQRKETLTGSVSAISGEELRKIPAVNVSNTIGGKLPGVVTITSSGEPGYDGSTIRIRGNHTLNDNSPLVVIDGVPGRSGGLERLNPNDIESISVLKDASAAIYGSRAANGVILITTKRGRDSARPNLSFNFNQGFNQPTRIPEMADAATYLTMLNEIDMYRNRQPSYSEEVIEAHRNGTDPWLYPDTDWFHEALKPMSMQTKADMSLSGGTGGLGYYLSLGGLTEDGYYRNSATRYNQYSFRSNIDGRVTDNISLRFDVNGRIEDRNFPTKSAGATFRALMRGKPNLPAYWPNGLPGPDIEYGDNPVVTGTDVTGVDNDKRYYLQGNLGLDVTIPWIKGLTIRGNAAYDEYFRERKLWQTPFYLYTWDYKTYDENGEPALQRASRGYSEPRLTQQSDRSTNILLNLVADYKRDLGPHSYGLLLGVERQTFESSWFNAYRRYFISDQIDQLFAGGEDERNNDGSAGIGARQNYFTRVNYDYQDKYLFEFIGRVDGSYIFPKEGRYGFFPAVSVGWRIGEENFFRNNVGFFDDLKIRASWGQTGNDRIDEWQYLASYGFGGGYVFGVSNEVKSLYQTRTPNPNITWEVANQFDVGIEGDILNNKLSFELDYFDYLRTDILHYRNASVPQTTGLSLPRENIGEVSSWGYDGSIIWRQQVNNDFYYDITLNAGYAQNKILYWDEPPGAPEWQRSTGRKMNTGLYYKAIGVFATEEDLEKYPHWANARPGDIIFEDVNGDGKITADDRVRINANNTPTWTGGLTFAGRYKQFDFNIFLQGAAGGKQYIYTESGEIGNYFADFARKRWTPDNPNSEHPRTFNRNDEYWISNRNTYFLRDTDYLRLKTVELGYSLPSALTNRMGLGVLRVYVSGFNLLTWDKLKVMDPEATNELGHYYPQKRVVNAGVNVTF